MFGKQNHNLKKTKIKRWETHLFKITQLRG